MHVALTLLGTFKISTIDNINKTRTTFENNEPLLIVKKNLQLFYESSLNQLTNQKPLHGYK